MKKASLLIVSLILLVFVNSASTPGHTQQARERRTWTVQNIKYVKLTAADFHLLAATSKEGTSMTTALHLPLGKPWKVAFDVQMGPMLAGSMSIHLSQGKTDVAWLGADSYYKSLSAFVGSGNAVMPFSQPWDTAWHSFAYISDGATLSLWHNGQKCGEKTSADAPDTLEIGNNGQEIRIKNVVVEALPANSLVGTAVAKEASAVKPVEVVSGTIGYQMSQFTMPVVGMLSQVAGVWRASVVIRNHTAKKVCLVPYCLLFDDGSREALYNSDGWRLIHDERTIAVPSVLGDGVSPTVDMHAAYITPTVDPVPTISIDPSTAQVIDVYAENGGGWVYMTTFSSDGRSSSSLSGDQKVNRTPKFAVFLQVPAAILATSVPLVQADRLMSSYSPDLLKPYKLFTTAVNTPPGPAKDDPRWIAAPLK